MDNRTVAHVLYCPQRALPTETKVENGTSQSKSGASVNLSNFGNAKAGGGQPHGRARPLLRHGAPYICFQSMNPEPTPSLVCIRFFVRFQDLRLIFLIFDFKREPPIAEQARDCPEGLAELLAMQDLLGRDPPITARNHWVETDNNGQ